MPYHNLKGNRESNIIHHENYRKVVLDYLSVKGYQEIASSSVEGCLTDIILKKYEYPNEPETHVELKWDEFSINNKAIRKEISEYFLLYLRLPPSRRFKFQIFARNILNDKLHKDIFNRLVFEEIKSICQKIESELNEKDLEFFKDTDENNKIDFFVDTTIYKGDIDDLKMAIIELTGDYTYDDDIHLRYRNIKEKENTEDKEETIISNMKEVKKSIKIWRARTDFISDREIRALLQYPPPFYLYEGFILSIYPFEDYNSLSAIIDNTTIEEIKINDWIPDLGSRNAIIALLNRTLKKYCELLGLYKKEGDNIYFFPAFSDESKAKEKWIMYKPIENYFKRRKCERTIFKEYFDQSENPIFWHLACNFGTICFDNKLYFIIQPKMLFTNDGVEISPSRRAKRVREKYFFDPNLSRNGNLLAQQLFWGFVFFLSPKLWLRPHYLFFTNNAEQEIEFHLTKFIGKIGKEYFKTFKILKTPIIKHDKAEELEEGEELEDNSEAEE